MYVYIYIYIYIHTGHDHIIYPDISCCINLYHNMFITYVVHHQIEYSKSQFMYSVVSIGARGAAREMYMIICNIYIYIYIHTYTLLHLYLTIYLLHPEEPALDAEVRQGRRRAEDPAVVVLLRPVC